MLRAMVPLIVELRSSVSFRLQPKLIFSFIIFTKIKYHFQPKLIFSFIILTKIE